VTLAGRLKAELADERLLHDGAAFVQRSCRLSDVTWYVFPERRFSKAKSSAPISRLGRTSEASGTQIVS
jgi:hypothetical protein